MKQRKYFIILPISVNHGSVMMVGEHTMSQREVIVFPPAVVSVFQANLFFFQPNYHQDNQENIIFSKVQN